MDRLVECTRCTASLPAEFAEKPRPTKCPGCGVLLEVAVFPALFRKPTSGESGETLLVDDEASCFYHPTKKAVVPCASCGRFLCALCDVDLGSRHLCPGCLEVGKRKRRLKNLENHRILYDSIALSLAIIPMLIIWPTLVTAPMVLYMTVRHWKTPGSIIPRTKIRFIVACFLAAVQILGWVVIIASWSA